MSMEHEDLLLGGDPGPQASRDNLEGVLRRHLRRRRRLTGGVAAVVLAIGAGGGVAIGEIVASGGQAAVLGPRATPQIAGSTGQGGQPAVSGANSAVGVPPPSVNGTASSTPPAGLSWESGQASEFGPIVPSATGGTASNSEPATCFGCVSSFVAPSARRLFERSANGIDVRVYEVRYGEAVVGSGSAEPQVALCQSTTSLLVEVSDAGAVGELTVAYPSTASKPVDLVSEDVVGVAEGSPMAILAVRVGSGVTSVGARFGNGAGDEMAVVDGLAVLVAPVPTGPSAADAAAKADVIAYGASGQQLQTFSTPEAPAIALPLECLAPLLPPRGGKPGSVSGSAGAGTAGVAGSSASAPPKS
jgi:hypothetical protein